MAAPVYIEQSITNNTSVDQVYWDYRNQAVTIAPGETKIVRVANYTSNGTTNGSTSLLTQISEDTTYYVSTTGSDLNDGTTTETAFATIQAAADFVSNDLFILAGITVTIQVLDGTYTQATFLRLLNGPGKCVIRGNSSTPGNVIVQTTGVGLNTFRADGVVNWEIRDMEVRASGSSSVAFQIINYGEVVLGNIRFGACGGAQIRCSTLAFISIQGNYAIVGGAQYHVFVQEHGVVYTVNGTATLTGTPAFSSGFAVATRGGVHLATSMVYSGGATGQRYNVAKNAVIDTNGGGANYFPGNSVGAAATGGQYI